MAAIDDDQVTGFAWRYVGRRGQYWTDLVSDTIPAEVVARWVGGHFEFVELAILPSRRQRGLGRALHDRLLEGISQRCLLGTSDDPAVHLCLDAGWAKLGDLRSGVQVMGLDRGGGE